MTVAGHQVLLFSFLGGGTLKSGEEKVQRKTANIYLFNTYYMPGTRLNAFGA